MKPKRLLLRLLEVAVLAASTIYIWRMLAQGWGAVASHLGQVNWWVLAVALICFFAYFACRVLAWGMIIGGLGYNLGAGATARIWLISELGRYVPGSVWSFVGRVYLAEQKGVPKRVTSTGLIAEMYWLLGSATLFGVPFLLLLPYANLYWLRWLLLLTPALLVVLSPKFFHWALRLLAKMTKSTLVAHTFAEVHLLRILAVFTLGWALYGFASYLVLQAFLPFGALNWIWLSSMFILSWLVGYLSFVTPMGLGVREGITVGLLAPLLGGSVAGLVALATRLWLTVSELVMLAALGALKLTKRWRPQVDRLFTWIAQRRYGVLAGVAMAVFIAYFGILICFWHANYVSNLFDLGIMDQTVWNTLHGHFMEMTSPLNTFNVSRFSIHADPILALLAPLYLVAASPYTLIMVQVVVVALGALPLYWLGKQVLKNEKLALLVAVAYLLFPPLQWGTTFAFHGVTLADTFILFAFYYLYNKRWVWFVLCAVLTLMCKETMALVVLALGLYILLKQRNLWMGLGTVVVSIGWFCVLLLYLMPATRGNGTAHFALAYYSQFGSSVGEIFKNLLLKPWLWIGDVWQYKYYVGYFLLPTALLPLLAPAEFALAIPTFAINLLSNQPNMQAIYYQYSSGINCITFIALLFGMARFRTVLWPWLATKIRWQMTKFISVTVASCALAALVIWGPIPSHRWFIGVNFVPALADNALPEANYLDQLAKTIPASATISATAALEPHFSERRYIYAFPLNSTTADYVITQENSGQEPDVYPPTLITQSIRQLEQDKRYQVLYHHGDIEVFKRL